MKYPVPALLCLMLCVPSAPPLHAQEPAALTTPEAVLDRAITRMGGEPALKGINSIRLDIMTQWHRTSFNELPFGTLPSYERNVELRDYTTNSWRNTRQFVGPGAAQYIVDVVRDTVAARYAPTQAGVASWVPLNRAYVGERRELFTFAPERLMLLARHAQILHLIPDTTIGGKPHYRLHANIDGKDVILFFSKSDGLPVLVRFNADEDDDFGLAPWGNQEIEFWYSAWQWMQPGVLLPRQRDVRRVGRVYKQMTVLGATINAPAPADSFPLSDAMAKLYLATEYRPMWNIPLDSARLVLPHLATFPPFTGTPAAIRIGGRWVMIESGQSAGAAALVASWLKKNAPETPMGAAIVTWPATGNGGVRWVADQKLPLYIAPGAAPFVRTMLAAKYPAATVVNASQWIKVGTDSLWLESLQVPDANGALAVYSPTHRWLYLAPGATVNVKFDLDALIARLEAKGMKVEKIGSSRNAAGAAR